MTRVRHLTAVPLLLLVLVACGETGSRAKAVVDCQRLSPLLLSRIVELAPVGSRFTVLKASGQKASNKASAWWVGVRFTAGRSGAPVTGIWATGGGLDGRGTLLVVDPVAQKWSQAVHADLSASKISATSGTEVLACL